MLNSLHCCTNQEVFETHLCNQGSHHEKIWTILVTQRKPSHATTKPMLFTVRKDEWNTTMVSPCGMPIGTSQAEATSNSEKIKPVALAAVKLCLTKGTYQSVRQSVRRKFRTIF